MAANVRYSSTYYNTPGGVSGTTITRRVEILDTEAVASVTQFQGTKPELSFEGLTVDLKPGIYPTSLSFGMYLRSTPKIINGVSWGTTYGILADIAEAAEGRFFAALYDDDVLQFIGPIIYDQCTWSDEEIPLLQITAVDGMARWSSEDYVSQVGQLVYYSMIDSTDAGYDNSPLLYDGPIVGVSPMTVLEHTVERHVVGSFTYWTQVTTFVHREIYSINSPGTGWVDQGQGLWAKSVPYTNEVEEETAPVSYHLTRDIDDEKHRTVAEIFQRAIQQTKMTGEYSGIMYDVAMEWREHSMDTGDPTTLMRLHEEPFLGSSWNDVVQEVLKLLNMRVYYARGRYHFEQISIRDSTTFTRYVYNADGTSGGADETASLDIDFSTLEIEPYTGGSNKFLAPLRSVEARVELDGSNLLEGIGWENGQYGTRYLGRVKQIAGDQKMWVVIKAAMTSTFDPITLALYPQSYINLICLHQQSIIYSVRITNINTATTYYLESGTNAGTTTGTWELTEAEITPAGNYFGNETRRYSPENYGYTIDRVFSILAETLPGSVGDMYDIHISLRSVVEFDNIVGATTWNTVHTNKFWTVVNAVDNTMRFYSTASLANYTNWVEADLDAELVYFAENDVENSVKVKMELQWADTGQFKKSIEIYNGTDWQRSAEWSIGGIGPAQSIGELLVYEIMSLRTVPKLIYSGSFVSSVPSAENRYKKVSYYYLPLGCTVDTDYDKFQGEFLQIQKTTPPDIQVIESPLPVDNPLSLNDAPPDEPVEVPLYFETNETITSGATLTEVDIVNTLGVYVAAGETVSIVHPTSGVSENVTLTQEILPSDTVMYFESNVMVNSYPDASYIVIQDGDVTIDSGGSTYFYQNDLYNGASHTVPIASIDFVALTGLTKQQIGKKILVYRNGNRMIPSNYLLPGASQNPQYFWYDIGTNQVIWNTDFEYVNEMIVIDIDLNR
jgi:hypothetical protein